MRSLPIRSRNNDILQPVASQAAAAIAHARAQGPAERTRALLEALVHTAPVGVLVLDAATGGLILVNQEAKRPVEGLRMAGGTSEQLLETATFRRPGGPEIDLSEFPLARALSDAETVRGEEVLLSVPDGRNVTLLINATPVHAADGSVASVVVTMQDLAPIRELERLRAEFLGLVSHELRTPLAAIKGSATTLLETAPDLDPAETREFHRVIADQADHMRGLIADLLDAGRIETGMLSVSPEPSEVSALVDRARNTFVSGGGRHAVHKLGDSASEPAYVRNVRRVGYRMPRPDRG